MKCSHDACTNEALPGSPTCGPCALSTATTSVFVKLDDERKAVLEAAAQAIMRMFVQARFYPHEIIAVLEICAEVVKTVHGIESAELIEVPKNATTFPAPSKGGNA